MSIPLIKKIAKDTATPFIVVERVWKQVQTHTTDLDLLCSITSRMINLKEDNSFDAFLKKEKIISRLIEEAKSKAVDFDGKLIFLNLGNLKTAIKKLENPDISSVRMKNGKTLEVTYKHESVYKNFLIKAMKQILPNVNLNVTVESPKNYLVTIHDDHSFLTGLKEAYWIPPEEPFNNVYTKLQKPAYNEVVEYFRKNNIKQGLGSDPIGTGSGLHFVSHTGVQIEKNTTSGGNHGSWPVMIKVKIGRIPNQDKTLKDIEAILKKHAAKFSYRYSTGMYAKDRPGIFTVRVEHGTAHSEVLLMNPDLSIVGSSHAPDILITNEDGYPVQESCREERELLDAPHSLEPKEWPVKTSLEEVDEKELKRGTKIELARTQNAESAKKVASYNLQLNPNYYKINNPVSEKPSKKKKIKESAEEPLVPETPAPDKERIEAYGVKGMKSLQWRKKFKNSEDLRKWAEENSAEVYGFRKLENGE